MLLTLISRRKRVCIQARLALGGQMLCLNAFANNLLIGNYNLRIAYDANNNGNFDNFI